MSVGIALVFLGMIAVAQDGAHVGGVYSRIEARLDDAQEKLVQAGAHACSDSQAQAAIRPLRDRFVTLQADAKRVLGRDLNLKIWVNACRRDGDGPRFRSLLNAARGHMDAASRLIARESQ